MMKQASQEDIIEVQNAVPPKEVHGEIVCLQKGFQFLLVFIPIDGFPYEEFFHQQILRKKKDHSYRVFKKVNRLAGPGKFPSALEYSWGEKPITVWCSNDYLGMSCHPEVKAAVRYLLLIMCDELNLI